MSTFIFTLKNENNILQDVRCEAYLSTFHQGKIM